MKRMRLMYLAAIALAFTHDANAQDLRGSDTLASVTRDVLASCPGGEGVGYAGGGSPFGEQAMVDGAQEIAPMSRFLDADAACSVGGGAAAEGVVIGLDGVSIVAAESTLTASCTGVVFTGSLAVSATDNGEAGLQCPGCVDAVYSFGGAQSAPWQDALRIVYTGVHNEGTRDCQSDVRAALLRDWSRFFEDDACQSGECATIRRLWRRADSSGTTDTLLQLLGLPDAQATPFCNGSDLEDLDPIRRPCAPDELVCQSDGTLGAVLPIVVPSVVDPPSGFNTSPCAEGVFTFELAPFGVLTCPNNTPTLFGQCLTPRDAAGNAGCINQAFNLPAFSDLSLDGRAYNLVVRKSDGTIVLDENNREIVGAFYRVRSTTLGAPQAPACAESSSTRQVGCLGELDGCSIGYAGREAAESAPGAVALAVDGRLPTDENVRRLLTPAPDPLTYPLARRLWLTTLVGFDNVSAPGQAAAAACFRDRAIVDAALLAAGFTPVDDDGSLALERVAFDSGQCIATGATTW